MKPYRSILSVPGHVQKIHTKAAESVADVIVLDLEDSVPQEAKEDARVRGLASLQTIDWQKKTVSIRINGLDTPYANRDTWDYHTVCRARRILRRADRI